MSFQLIKKVINYVKYFVKHNHITTCNTTSCFIYFSLNAIIYYNLNSIFIYLFLFYEAEHVDLTCFMR